MATTKIEDAVFTALSLANGGSDQTSAESDLSGSYHAVLGLTLTNGATGPTVPAEAWVEINSSSGIGVWHQLGGPLVGGTANSGVYSFVVEIPPAARRVRVKAGKNTGQAVTINASISKISAIQ